MRLLKFMLLFLCYATAAHANENDDGSLLIQAYTCETLLIENNRAGDAFPFSFLKDTLLDKSRNEHGDELTKKIEWKLKGYVYGMSESEVQNWISICLDWREELKGKLPT